MGVKFLFFVLVLVVVNINSTKADDCRFEQALNQGWNTVTLTIQPENTENKKYNLVFEAIGNCFSDSTIIPAISTQLELNVMINPKETNIIERTRSSGSNIIKNSVEKIIEVIQAKPSVKSEPNIGITNKVSFTNENKENIQLNDNVIEKIAIQKIVFMSLIAIVVILMVIKFILK